MRILVLSNLYPPHYVGGYELGCRDVVTGLKARGHEVAVLTSTYGLGKPETDGDIHRWLIADLGWKNRERADVKKLLDKERTNQTVFKQLCRSYKPDLIYAWNLTHISITLLFIAQRMGLPICYYIFDNWLSRWESDPWYALRHRQPGRLHRRMVWGIFQFFFRASGVLPSASDLDLRGAQFASGYLKRVALESGKSIGDAKVIHWGLDVSQYPDKPASRHPHKLLYVGQIVEHKGVHTAVEALKILIEKYGRKATTLTIAGGSVIKPEETRVRNMVRDFGLENNVRLTGLLPREELPAVYQEHDIFLFPSVWDEPFGITLLESMASGLPVVGTGTGGSAEITQHEQNALLYPKGDAEACAAQVVRLMDDPTLFERMQQNGRRTVEEKFRFETTMDSIENALGEALS